MVEVHSWAKTVLSVFAAFTASRIASMVKAGPLVSACGSGARAGSGGRLAGGRASASRLTASAGSPMRMCPTGARAASSGSDVTAHSSVPAGR